MIEYHVFLPGGNRTALVMETIPPEDRTRIAVELMARDPSIEQVGFITAPQHPSHAFRLHMMGDELCINAALCAGFAHLRGTPNDSCLFEVSGSPEPLQAIVHEERVTLVLPDALITSAHQIPEGWRVELQGIRVVLTGDASLLERAQEILDRHAEPSVPASALIYRTQRGPHLSITPIVHVRSTNTLIRESACGSGSIAAAYISMRETGLTEFTALQLSGETYAVSFRDGRIRYEGKVVDEGERSFQDGSNMQPE